MVTTEGHRVGGSFLLALRWTVGVGVRGGLRRRRSQAGKTGREHSVQQLVAAPAVEERHIFFNRERVTP